MKPIRYDESRAGERRLPATGRNWSGFASALDREAEHLMMAAAIDANADALESVLQPRVIEAMRRDAQRERAAARAAVAFYLPPASTFGGDPVPVHPEQLRIV